MNRLDEQRREIATIRDRTITLRLSDADCERIARKAGEGGLTVGELLENFIGDLVGGTYTNGSDERMYAQDWFERCWFGGCPGNTLLRHLLERGEDVDDFLTAYDEKIHYAEHPEEYAEEIAELEAGEKLWFAEEVDAALGGWMPEAGGDMEKEVELCRKWLAEYQQLMKMENGLLTDQREIVTVGFTRKEARAISSFLGGCDGYLALHVLSRCHPDTLEELLEQERIAILHGWLKINQAIE